MSSAVGVPAGKAVGSVPTIKHWIVGLSVAVACACTSENLADWNQSGIVSPDGRAKARLSRIDSLSQVFVSFDRGRCGGGSVSTTDVNPDLRLSWRDDTTLEVSAPAAVSLQPAPASRTLNHRVQCLDHSVDVVVSRR